MQIPYARKGFISLVTLLILLLMLPVFSMPEEAVATQPDVAWHTEPIPDPAVMRGLLALDENHVWAVGSSGRILFYDGRSWTKQESGSAQMIMSMSAVDQNHIWAVGDGDNDPVLFYDGSSWNKQAFPKNEGSYVCESLSGVYACDNKHVWATGCHSHIYFYDGRKWALQYKHRAPCMAIDGLGRDYVWATTGTSILFFNGDSWKKKTGNLGYLYDIDVFDKRNAWAVGSGGRIFRYNGSEWSAQQSGTTYNITGVTVRSHNDVWAVGATTNMMQLGQGNGFVLHYDGSSWKEVYTITDTPLYAVTSVGNDRILAVGGGGLAVWGDLGSPPAPPAVDRTWAHDSIGTSVPSKTWYLAEGCTGTGFETWVLVANPTNQNADVTLTYMTPDGPQPGPAETLPPGTRRSYNVYDSVPGAFDVSTKVESTTPVVAERSMYGISI